MVLTLDDMNDSSEPTIAKGRFARSTLSTATKSGCNVIVVLIHISESLGPREFAHWFRLATCQLCAYGSCAHTVDPNRLVL